VIGRLTRADAARILGKTVSTVRRLEGEVLFPVRDERGVYWFERGAVERIAERIRDGRIRCARSEYLKTTQARRRRGKGELSKARRENDRLRRANSRLAERVVELERHLASARARS